MIPIIIGAVVVLALMHKSGGAAGAAFGPGQFVGHPPAPGGADGSPQSQLAAAHSGTTTAGNSEQRIAHGLESALGAGAGAGACAIAGLGGAAPACAKLGALLGPTAFKLQGDLLKAQLYVANKAVQGTSYLANKTAAAGAFLPIQAGNYADRGFSALGKLPTPLAYTAKAALLPIKLTADASADIAKGGKAVVSGVTSGLKSASSAAEHYGSKVLGWL